MTQLKDRVRADYDELSDRYDRRWRRYIERSVHETLVRTPVHAADRVLDVGCGTGTLLRVLSSRVPSIRVAGVDLSYGMVRIAASRASGSVVTGDAERLPFHDAMFNVVVSSSSFHFWPHPEAGLAECRRVLHGAGRLVVTDWCDDYLGCRLYESYLRLRDPAHQRIFGEEELAEMLRRSGFRVVSLERYKISVFWGLMTAIAEVD